MFSKMQRYNSLLGTRLNSWHLIRTRSIEKMVFFIRALKQGKINKSNQQLSIQRKKYGQTNQLLFSSYGWIDPKLEGLDQVFNSGSNSSRGCGWDKVLNKSSASSMIQYLPSNNPARSWIAGNYVGTYVHSKYSSSIELAQQPYRLQLGYRLATTWLPLGNHLNTT